MLCPSLQHPPPYAASKLRVRMINADRSDFGMGSDAVVKEVLDDLYTLLESIETQNIALVQFLRDQGIAPDEKLRPYLEQAGNASSVKWRAARARMNHLFAPAPKKATEAVTARSKPDSAQPAAANASEAKPEDHKPDQSRQTHPSPEHSSSKRDPKDQAKQEREATPQGQKEQDPQAAPAVHTSSDGKHKQS